MLTKLIYFARKSYSAIFLGVRKIHISVLVYKQKTRNSHARVLTKQQSRAVKRYYSGYQRISDVFHNFYTEKRENTILSTFLMTFILIN